MQIFQDLDFEAVARDFAVALRGEDIFEGSLTRTQSLAPCV